MTRLLKHRTKQALASFKFFPHPPRPLRLTAPMPSRDCFTPPRRWWQFWRAR